jgi:P27 family predicted phage terminase small subunit
MPRKSTNKQKKMRGSHRKERTKPTLATAPIEPEPDAGLDSIARAEWTRVTAAMANNGLVTILDAAVLAAYCTNFSRWKRAEAAVARDGEILFTEVRDTHRVVIAEKPMKNPMLSVSECAQRLMSRFADQLGLSPSGRSKLGFEHGDGEEDENSLSSMFPDEVSKIAVRH